MGETFYSVLVKLFTNEHNHYLSSDQIVSNGLASIGSSCALAALSMMLYWLTRKSVLARRSLVVKLFTAYFAMLSCQFLAQVVAFPDLPKLALDYVSTITGVLIALVVFQRRHIIVGAIYEYKYAIGLIKTVNTFNRVE